MFLSVFAGARRRNDEIVKFQFLIHSASKKVQESACDSGIFLTYFTVLSLVFKMNQIITKKLPI